MSKSVKISIITPSFNQSEFLERTILSIYTLETNFEIEHIVIDGGSTDGSLDILRNFSKELTWISAADRGQSDAINKGVLLAHGEIIGWLNSDDVYLPGALQKVIKYFDAHPECGWVYGKCKIIDEQELETRKWLTLYKNFFLDKFNLNMLFVENFISQPAVFFKKSIFIDAGMLDKDLPFAMDYDLWIRFAKKSKPGFINDYLACFRVHETAKSRLHSRKQFIEQYNIHKKYDNRTLLLFLHRINIYKTIFGYWVIENIHRFKRK